MARVIREPEYEPPHARVEILHHEPAVAAQLAQALRDTPLGFECDVVVRPPSRSMAEDTDVLVVSYPLALGGEQPLLRRFGFDESAPPIMVVDAAESSVRRVTAFDAGADDYITPQTPPAELAARLASTLRRQRRQQQLRSARDRATLAAVTDPLTGLYNRAYFQEALAIEARRVDRYGRPMTVALLDLDHFKRVNDTLGHGAGDEALREVALRLRRAVRSTDVLARYGGEEFVVMLPETGVKNALQAAERLRAAVDGLTVTGAHGGSRAITVSVGVACLPTHATTLAELMQHADTALYAAKRAGRNRVCLAAPGTEGAAAPKRAEPDPLAALERLRQLLAEDGDGPLSSVRTAARMLHAAASPGDPLEVLTRQLHESSEEVRRELHGALEALAPLLESRH
jgi:two-component system cell cycle response regulator